MLEARALENRSKVIGPVAALPACIASDFRNAVEMRLTLGVIVVAVPHNVFGVGTLAAALWMITFVAVVDGGCLEAVGGSNASSQNGLQEPPILEIRAVVMVGVFCAKVGHGRIVVKVCTQPNHVFAVAVRLFDTVRVDGLIDALLQVVEDGIPGRFADGHVVIGGMGGVKRKLRPVWEYQDDDALRDGEVDVESHRGPVEPIGGSLRKAREVTRAGTVPPDYLTEIVRKLLVSV